MHVIQKNNFLLNLLPTYLEHYINFVSSQTKTNYTTLMHRTVLHNSHKSAESALELNLQLIATGSLTGTSPISPEDCDGRPKGARFYTRPAKTVHTTPLFSPRQNNAYMQCCCTPFWLCMAEIPSRLLRKCREDGSLQIKINVRQRSTFTVCLKKMMYSTWTPSD